MCAAIGEPNRSSYGRYGTRAKDQGHTVNVIKVIGETKSSKLALWGVMFAMVLSSFFTAKSLSSIRRTASALTFTQFVGGSFRIFFAE